MLKHFGLIGYPLSHSFSKRFFSEKFEREGIQDCVYDLFEMPSLDNFKSFIIQNPHLRGLNVTIPHKKNIIPLLDSLDTKAERIGAVNVIRIEKDGTTKGYNSDYYGFKESLQTFIYGKNIQKALILGNGGAAQAVRVALDDLHIEWCYVVRTEQPNALLYTQLSPKIIQEYPLIINTTPLGMYPHIEACPPIPYEVLTAHHLLYDLVYNPENTLFMQKGQEKKAFVKNGLEMLHLQALKAWEIWNE